MVSSEPPTDGTSTESTIREVSEELVTTEVSAVTTEALAVTITNKMYLEVITTKTSTGDLKSESELTNYETMYIDQIKIDGEETVIAKSRRTSAPGYGTCLLCNVALQRPTTSTSIYTYDNTIDGNACNAVDGWRSTDFYRGTCYYSHEEDPNPSVTVDLGDIYDIQNVGFALREDNLQFKHYTKLSNLKIYVRNETGVQPEVCGVYSDVPTLDDIGKLILVNCFVFARYVTVKKFSKDLQFCEMRVKANIQSSHSCPEPPQSWYCRDLCYDVAGSNKCPQKISVESTTNEVSLGPTPIMVSSEPLTIREVSQEPVTTDVPAVTTEVSLVTTKISAVTTEVPVVTTTNEMYLEVTTTEISTGDVTMDATFTEITTNSQDSKTQYVCPCPSEKSESELTNYVNMLINQIKIDGEETAIAKSKKTSAPDSRGSSKAIGYVGIIVIICPVLVFVAIDIVTFIKFHSSN
ncbi:unnamed protein product [Mytilus coruscus]|uniref:F5/8 type C domain-containing protein n=1 Tax=Mytilus coruscus TaxID=42192 RepID=A0A6J8BCW4_MYTCO|nr:unnamed protein product [Mytilus coruscus]